MGQYHKKGRRWRGKKKKEGTFRGRASERAGMSQASNVVRKLDKMKKEIEEYFEHELTQAQRSWLGRVTSSTMQFRRAALENKIITSDRKLLRIFINLEPTTELKREARELLRKLPEQ